MKKNRFSVRKFVNKHSSFVLMAPYTFLFSLFIIIPVGAAIVLSFTSFNAISRPTFLGLSNYVNLLTNDAVFMQNVLPNTVIYAIFVGAGGYVLSFFLAWSLSQISRIPRTIMTVILYSPSVTGGVLLSTIWSAVFNGDKRGLLNSLLLKLDLPILEISSPPYKRKFFMVHDGKVFMPPAVRAFRDYVRKKAAGENYI